MLDCIQKALIEADHAIGLKGENVWASTHAMLEVRQHASSAILSNTLQCGINTRAGAKPSVNNRRKLSSYAAWT